MSAPVVPTAEPRMVRALRSMSLTRRLKLVFLVLNSFTLLCAFVGFVLIMLYDARRTFTDELRSLGDLLSATTRAALAFNDAETGSRVLAALQAKQEVTHAVLFRNDGSVLALYGSDHRSPAELSQLPELHYHWRWNDVTFSREVRLDGDRIGSLALVASLAPLYSQLRWLLLVGGSVALIIGVGITLLSQRLKVWVSKPVDQLRTLVDKISSTKDLSARLAVTREDEIHGLIGSVNAMLEELQDRDKSLLLAKERAESADRAKSLFVASVSHEFRTPLHAIMGMTDELLQSSPSRDQQELLLTIKSSATSLLSLINDILDFSKIEAGKFVLAPTTWNARTALQDILRMFSVPFRAKNISLSAEISPSVPHEIVLDGHRFAQIVINLIGNALKFTPAGGSVTIHISDEPTESMPAVLKCVVSDTGVGIPDDHLSNIFDAFTQVQRDATAIKGTGLGLAICARLVTLMGGCIWATSKVGQGSQFHFLVSYTAAPSVALLPTEPPPPLNQSSPTALLNRADQPLNILVVDDNPVNRMLAKRLLERRGFRVTLAEDGSEAVSAFQRQYFDAILMDVNMPVMDGLEATQRIRELEKATDRHTPIIAATASVGPDGLAVCLGAGMDAMIQKPFTGDQLMETVARFLPNHPKHLRITDTEH